LGPRAIVMKLPRRKFLHLAAGAATLPSLSVAASADDYPTRPVKIVVGFAAGGAVDIVARLIGQWLSERIGQQCVVENRPGAGNNIATEYVLKSDPDGYTLLLTNPTNAINATYYETLPYDFIRDSAPVAGIMRVPNVMEVSPLLSANSVPEFIALAKANPGKLAYATGGTPTLERWQPGETTRPGVYALLFSGLRGDKGTGGRIGVARIERTDTRRQKRCAHERNDGKRPLAGFHGSTPLQHDPKKWAPVFR